MIWLIGLSAKNVHNFYVTFCGRVSSLAFKIDILNECYGSFRNIDFCLFLDLGDKF